MRIEGNSFIVPTFDLDTNEMGEEIVFDLLMPDQAKEAVSMLIDQITDLTTELEALDEMKAFYIEASKN